MEPVRKTLKVSSKGQITLPKPVRDHLRDDIVVIVSDEKGVRIERLPDLAGSLKRYAKNAPKGLDWKQIRELGWDREIADEWKSTGPRRQRRRAVSGR
jgi:bifunctional DNA-binding transcriptional regulator/antitoxin component of YhaV-PrlF toxin-antitoxin module